MAKRRTNRPEGRRGTTAPRGSALTNDPARRSVHADRPRRVRSRWLVGAAAVFGVLSVYLLTLSRTVPTGDSGELIAAAYTHGVAHPPGYPLVTMLGFLVTRIPIASPALLMNLLSGVLSVGAVAVLFAAAVRLTEMLGLDAGRTSHIWDAVGPLAAAVGLGLSTAFWANAIVAEVFALNSLFAAGLLYTALESYRDPTRPRYLYATALLFGLGLANQQTIVLLAPALAILFIADRRRPSGISAKSPGRPIRRLVVAAVLVLVGMTPYLYLPLAARTDPPMNWGDPRDLGALLAVMTRSTYGSLSLVAGDRHGSILENLSLFGSYLVTAFTPIGCLLAIGGTAVALRRDRVIGLALLVGFVVAGPVFLAFANVSLESPLTRGVLERFYILPSIPFALLVGAGVAWVIEAARSATSRHPRLGSSTIVAVVAVLAIGSPVLAGGLRFSAQDRSNDRVAEDYASDILAELEPDAVLLMRSDENFTSLAYAQNVAGVRPDVVALDVELLKLPTYVSHVRRTHRDVVIPWDSYDDGIGTKLADLVAANIERRPVYFIGEMPEATFASGYDDLRAGLVHRLAPQTGRNEYDLLRTNPFLVGRLHFPDRDYGPTTWEQAIAETYAQAAFDQAFALQTGSATTDGPSITHYYRTAIRLRPNEGLAYKNLGLFLLQNGGDRAEVARLWTEFLRLAPSDKDGAAIRSQLDSLPKP